ncbi:hypothetical protein M3649_18525 [Ureibacillus chungkukjangi]|uniref:hypothetical protein n=1 Tax=Ureibacillus chungkukjangi TaxID=1202712 RepID=UPI00203FC4B3|nr:hypothetical protein [Ureibacillus chungkukjangi]MCM3390096.1 hypothetical protein [Ureibacillus chungkukjangi]
MYKLLTVVSLLFLIAGCSYDSSEEQVKKGSKKLLPPVVQLEIEDTVYNMEQGDYCWRDEESAECLSLPTPIEILEYEKALPIKKKATVTLLTKRRPTEQTLTISDVESNQIEEISLTKNHKFKAPAKKGVYIINYYAIWEKNDSGTSGDSSYVFKIEVK